MQIKYHTELCMEFRIPPSRKAIFIFLIFPILIYVFRSFLNPLFALFLCLASMGFAISGYRKAWGLLDASSDFVYLSYTNLFRRWEYEGPLNQITEFRIQKIGLGTYELLIDNTTTFPFRWVLVGTPPKKLVQLVSELNTFLYIERPETLAPVNLPQNILPKKPRGTCKFCWGDVYLTPRFKDILGQYAHQGCQDARDYEKQQRNSNRRD